MRRSLGSEEVFQLNYIRRGGKCYIYYIYCLSYCVKQLGPGYFAHSNADVSIIFYPIY